MLLLLLLLLLTRMDGWMGYWFGIIYYSCGEFKKEPLKGNHSYGIGWLIWVHWCWSNSHFAIFQHSKVQWNLQLEKVINWEGITKSMKIDLIGYVDKQMGEVIVNIYYKKKNIFASYFVNLKVTSFHQVFKNFSVAFKKRTSRVSAVDIKLLKKHKQADI